MKIPKIIRTVGWPVLSGRGAMAIMAIGIVLMPYAFSTVFTGNSTYAPQIFGIGFLLVTVGSASIYALASERWYRGMWAHYELTAFAIISNILTAMFLSVPPIVGYFAR